MFGRIRVSAPAVARRSAAPPAAPIRRMSSAPVGPPAVENWDKETFNWQLASIAVVPVIVGMSLYGWVVEKQHAKHEAHHPFQKPLYPYLRTNVKKWPWQNKECTFWDMDCHKVADIKRKTGATGH